MKTRNLVLVILSIAVFLIIVIGWNSASASFNSSQTQSSILYVKKSASGDCSTWTNACELQTALSMAVSGDQIWVADGIYKPTIDTNREATFQLKSGVAIYGGFPGNGGTWEERDWETNLTILSGDIGTPTSYTDNSYHVLTGGGTDASAVLDGFTISGGNADSTDPHNNGGGLYNDASSPTLANVCFSGNSAMSQGGGMYNTHASSPALTNVTFCGNSAAWAGGGMFSHSYSSSTLSNVTFSGNSARYGGGMYNNYYSIPTLTDVTFSGNTAPDGGGMYNKKSSPTLTNVTFSSNSAVAHGGGMYNYDNSSPTLTNVTFSGNTASSDGGGMYNDSSSPALTSVTFSGNTAPDGGGMYNYYTSSPTLTNVTFSSNTSNHFGGGMYNYENSSPTLTNVTFSGNTAEEGGGMYNNSYSNPSLTNVTFSGNTAEVGGGMYNDFYISPTLTDVTFNSNTASLDGGGMYNYENSSPTLTNATFEDNSAGSSGGGMYNYIDSSPSLTDVTFSGNTASLDGGGMYNEYSSPILMNVTINSNTAGSNGGGMRNGNNSYVSLNNVTFSDNEAAQEGGGMFNSISSPMLTNVTFSGNSSFSGGGMYNYSSSPTLTNVTFNSNSADHGGGICNYEISFPTLVNTILWANTPDQINNGGTSTATVTYSDIQGPGVYPGTGNINQDPSLLPLADNGGFTQTHALGVGSPAIDAGDPNPDNCPATDQRGFPRPIDGDADGTALCDMGAYEFVETFYAKPGSSGDCSSWSSACELRQALLIASSDVQIWAAAGTYKPTAGTDRTATFQLKSGVAIYGGFPENGGTWEERDWETNITTLSGDIGTTWLSIDNSYHVVTGSGTDASAVLDGFTITGGNANGVEEIQKSGGGMYNDASSPSLNNLIFKSNFADYGGGLYNEDSSPAMSNITFCENSSVSLGGGMYNYYSGSILTNVTFSSNSAVDDGGGMYNYYSNLSMTNVTFHDNTAESGGAMYNNNSSPTLLAITFSDNTAGIDGGGIYNSETSSPTLVNTILWGNSPDQIYNDTISTATVTYSDIEGDDVYPGMGNINQDPLLLPPADNGGYTLTCALGVGSPAIDAGDPVNCPPTDQRGYVRPIDANEDGIARCDMGAVEIGYTLSVTSVGGGSVSRDPQTNDYQPGDEVTLTANPEPCNLFYSWSEDASGNTNPLTITISGNTSITATFANLAIFYVKENGTGDCTSWANACELSLATDAACAGDEIRVAAGTYKPTTGSDRLATFALKSGVEIYGGFPSVGGGWETRDWESNTTTLSGDIGTSGDNSDNSYHVVIGDGPDSTAVLDAFTISGGNADNMEAISSGAGMFIYQGSPNLTNLIFSANYAATYGGGLTNYFSNPTLMNVTFTGNIAGYNGGGMSNASNSSPTLTNVTFSDNEAAQEGGGMFNSGSDPTLTNVTFSGNSAESGGGMYNLTGSPSLTNVTFSGNSAGSGGGMCNSESSSPTLVNTILWANTPDQINNDGTSTAAVTYSDIQGEEIWGGIGNINEDPLLGPLADNGGFTLTHALGVGSPAIDAGDPNPDNCPPTDQRGFPRPIDGDGVDGPRCDMGAYEAEFSVWDFSIYLPLVLR